MFIATYHKRANEIARLNYLKGDDEKKTELEAGQIKYSIEGHSVKLLVLNFIGFS